MNLKPSAKRPYKSGYGGGYITAQAYLVELICEKIAIRNRRKLTERFWDDAYWGGIFKKQLVLANNLLKLYEPLPIINALKSPDAKIVSLGMAAQLDPLIEREKKKLVIAPGKKTIEAVRTDEKPMPQAPKSNMFSKLKGL